METVWLIPSLAPSGGRSIVGRPRRRTNPKGGLRPRTVAGRAAGAPARAKGFDIRIDRQLA